MNKHEYLEELTHQLRVIPDDEIERARAFYSKSIDDRREEGLSEQEAVASLESPVEAAQRIISELPTRPRATAKLHAEKTSSFNRTAPANADTTDSSLSVPLLIGITILTLIVALVLIGIWVAVISLLVGTPVVLIGTIGLGHGDIAITLAGVGLGPHGRLRAFWFTSRACCDALDEIPHCMGVSSNRCFRMISASYPMPNKSLPGCGIP